MSDSNKLAATVARALPLALLLTTSCASSAPATRPLDAPRLGVGSRPRALALQVAPRRQGASPVLDASLGGYVQHALEHSPVLRAAFEGWRALEERETLAEGLPDPVLSYGEFLEEIETRTGPQERRIGLTQGLPWPGQRGARSDVAGHRAAAAKHRIDAERLRVVEAVELAFHDYAFLGAERRIKAELLQLLRGLEPVVQSRVRGGVGQEDLLRLQVEVGRLEDDLARIERRVPVLSARLADAAYLWRGDVLPVPELEPPSEADLPESEEAALEALEASPGLDALGQELAAARASREVAVLDRRPHFTVGVDWFQTGDAIVPNTAGSGDDPLLLRVSMSLPVWGTQNSAAERQAEHDERRVASRLAAARSELRVRVEEETFGASDSARRVALYRDSLLPRAIEALELTLSAYRTGSASILDVIEAERGRLELELVYWSACRDVHQSRARLAALLGEDL